MSFDDRSPNDQEIERQAMTLLRSARGLRGLSPLQIEQIEKRLEFPPLQTKWTGRRLAAVAAAVVLMLAGTFAAARVELRRLPLVRSLFSAPAGGQAAVIGDPRPRAPAPSIPEPEGAIGSSGVMPPPVAPPGRKVVPSARSRPMVDARSTPSVAPRPPVEAASRGDRLQEDATVVESRSFSAAIGKWHRDHDARAALVALDDHERRFPGGQFQLEARLVRAEILLREGREREGLRLLEATDLPGLPRARELLTVRGELRIKFGLCEEGRRDLEAVLAKDETDTFAERAHRAIRLCR